MKNRPTLASPSPGGGGVEFVSPADDTPENQVIVELVEERATADGSARELTDVIREFGYDPAEFLVGD